MNTDTGMQKQAQDVFNNSAFGRLVTALMAQEPGITHGEAVRRTAEARPDAHENYLRSIGWITSGAVDAAIEPMPTTANSTPAGTAGILTGQQRLNALMDRIMALPANGGQR